MEENGTWKYASLTDSTSRTLSSSSSESHFQDVELPSPGREQKRKKNEEKQQRKQILPKATQLCEEMGSEFYALNTEFGVRGTIRIIRRIASPSGSSCQRLHFLLERCYRCFWIETNAERSTDIRLVERIRNLKVGDEVEFSFINRKIKTYSHSFVTGLDGIPLQNLTLVSPRSASKSRAAPLIHRLTSLIIND